MKKDHYRPIWMHKSLRPQEEKSKLGGQAVARNKRNEKRGSQQIDIDKERLDNALKNWFVNVTE